MGSEQECVAATALNYGVYSSDLHLYHINAARAECTRINGTPRALASLCALTCRGLQRRMWRSRRRRCWS